MRDENTGHGNEKAAGWNLTRYDFLNASGAVIGVLSMRPSAADADGAKNKAKLRFGIVTDSHYADAISKGSRY